LFFNPSSVLHHLLRRPDFVPLCEFFKIPRPAYNAIVVVTLSSV
jgi:hypothetical protein